MPVNEQDIVKTLNYIKQLIDAVISYYEEETPGHVLNPHRASCTTPTKKHCPSAHPHHRKRPGRKVAKPR